MSNSVVLTSEFKIENVSFGVPRKNAQGGQSVLVSYYNEATDRTGALILQTPRCKMPFGPDIGEFDGKKTNRFSINFSLASKDSQNANLIAFSEIIKAIDDKAKTASKTEHAQNWFGKVHSADMIEEMYKSSIKKSKNEKYASTLKIKLPVKINGDKIVPQFDVYNEKREVQNLINELGDINLECLEKGADSCAIMQCTGLWWVGNTQFGVGWKMCQCKTYPTQKLVGYSIVDEEEEVEEVEEEEEVVG
jgi:hypothetical protein